MKSLALATAVLLILPAAAAAQEYDVTRRSYPFLDDRLVVQVETETPGALRVVRGDRGRIEVAGRASRGFVGFGLAGDVVRQLRLTAMGGDRVEYLLVVPEHVHLSVQLPRQHAASAGPVGGTYIWGTPDTSGVAAGTLLPTQSGMLVVHEAAAAPALLDLPDLVAVRSLSVRFQGERFRVTSSREVEVRPTAGNTLQIPVAGGDPIDIIVYVPWTARGFEVRGGGRRLVQRQAGRPVSECSGVAVQEPTPEQIWYTLYARAGRPVCG